MIAVYLLRPFILRPVTLFAGRGHWDAGLLLMMGAAACSRGTAPVHATRVHRCAVSADVSERQRPA